MKEKLVVDIEVSPNYYLVGFKRLSDGKKLQIEVKGADTSLTKEQMKTLKSTLKTYTTIGFNSNRYDMPIMLKSLEYSTCEQIFKMSCNIIQGNLQVWQTYKMYDIETDPSLFDHIDISEPSPAVFVSLKKYGTRLGTKKLQELPYLYDKILTNAEMIEMAKYNVNDLDVTVELYKAIEDRIDLRVDMSKEYHEDLRSKSDAQIAETVIVKELAKSGVKAVKPQMPTIVRYTPPSCIEFDRPILQGLLKRVQTEAFKINPKNGQPVIPEWMKKFPLTIGDTSYQIGLGGLHSKEKSLAVIPNDDEVMRNIDVEAYYPSMILEFNFYPKRLTAKFLDIYEKLYITRVKAKHEQKRLEKVLKYTDTDDDMFEIMTTEYHQAKAKNEGGKITINGSFGKFGSMYSKLYAPELMLQVTITGQLMLLMLIEQVEALDMRVVSSNTDGIELVCPKSRVDELEALVFDWELSTGMVMEHGEYKALYARDVNAYVAVYDGYIKAKGVYAEPTLSKDSEYPIVFEAVRQYLLKGTPIEDTIQDCHEVNLFATSRVVKYGGWWRDEYVGKIVRFIYIEDGDPITFTSPKTGKSGNKVAKSDGCMPVMDLPDSVPYELDYERYITIAIKALKDLGVEYG